MSKIEIKQQIFNLIKQYFELNDQENGRDLSKKIGVAFPCFDHLEVNSAIDSLLKLEISQGEKVKKFEKNFPNILEPNME